VEEKRCNGSTETGWPHTPGQNILEVLRQNKESRGAELERAEE